MKLTIFQSTLLVLCILFMTLYFFLDNLYYIIGVIVPFGIQIYLNLKNIRKDGGKR